MVAETGNRQWTDRKALSHQVSEVVIVRQGRKHVVFQVRDFGRSPYDRPHEREG